MSGDPSTDPWQGDDPPVPRRPGWGCLLAVIVSVIGVAVVAVLATGLLGAVLGGMRIR